MKIITSLLRTQILHKHHGWLLSSCYYYVSSNKYRNYSKVPTVSDDALTSAYIEYGDNQTTASPILIMHGLFGSKQNWKSVSKVLAAKTKPERKIYVLDARNHGETSHSNEHSYDHLAADVAKFHQDHQISKSIVIGHSMGGRAMMCFALKYVR